MTSDADGLEREIEASRGRLDRTLDRLTQRLTPTGIAEDVLGTVRRDATGAGLYDGALAAVRRNPVPVLLMCLGAVMLLKGMGPRASTTYRAVRDPDRYAAAAVTSTPMDSR
ncbi:MULTISPECIES: DUF3618 domain-containing protein [unclassified Methylobacterium]|uniref:DUF3618 domain-containing protein n=1 Tax=unclassified Methylobacterium TaxID=2615210 RepID=UPI001FBAB653|nr:MULTISPECIES: DUF3618 domain-containing protein [unclassified Methylobacterium]MCJ2101817.1 DUF3618 domain-containing protein [Methylobacterium sp. E-046]MCJ2124605.1 DUF3618 domain-containing protein [Methylobacterium sp. J-077]